jgi:hypothetical protein
MAGIPAPLGAAAPENFSPFNARSSSRTRRRHAEIALADLHSEAFASVDSTRCAVPRSGPVYLVITSGGMVYMQGMTALQARQLARALAVAADAAELTAGRAGGGQ